MGRTGRSTGPRRRTRGRRGSRQADGRRSHLVHEHGIVRIENRELRPMARRRRLERDHRPYPERPDVHKQSKQHEARKGRKVPVGRERPPYGRPRRPPPRRQSSLGYPYRGRGSKDRKKGSKRKKGQSIEKKRRGIRRKIIVLLLVLGMVVIGYAAIYQYALGVVEETEITIERIVVRDGETAINVSVDAVIDIPTSRDTSLEEVDIDVMYRTTLLHHFDEAPDGMEGGNSKVHLEFDIEPSTYGVGRFVDDLMEMRTIYIRIVGTVRNQGIISFELPVDKHVPIKGFGRLDVDTDTIEVPMIDDDGIDVKVSASVDNPSDIEVEIDRLSFDVLYNGTPFELIDTDGFLKQGRNELAFDLSIPADAGWIYNDIIERLLDDGTPAPFSIAGRNVTGSVLSEYLVDFVRVIEFEAGDGLGVRISDSSTNIGLFSTDIDITVEIDNPTEISANITDLDLYIYANGEFLEHIHYNDLQIVPGKQNIGISMTLSNFAMIGRLGTVLDFITGGPIDVTVAVERMFDAENGISFEYGLIWYP